MTWLLNQGNSGYLPLAEWVSSTRFRRWVLTQSAFPLTDDVPAFLVANQLARRGPLRPSVIADVLEYGASNVSKCVARLEASGLVKRVVDPADDRAVLITLTDAGQEWAARLQAHNEQVLADILQDWTPAEVAILAVLDEKLEASMRSLMERQGPRE